MKSLRTRTFIFYFSTIFFASIIMLVVWILQIDSMWSPIFEPVLRERQARGSIGIFARDKNNKQIWLGAFSGGRRENREPVSLSSMPPLLVQSIVVLEDPRYLEHGGFDIWGIFRALVKNVLSFRYAQGGSTITQQLVKNIFLSHEKTLGRKFTELVLSVLLEKRFTKDEILEAYLNEVYFGQLGSIEIHGVAKASEYYFQKKLSDIELPQMALLAAMIASPGLYSPWKNPDKALARRNRVLQSLAKANLILPEELDNALKVPLPPKAPAITASRAAYLLDALRNLLIEERGEYEVLRGGFNVELGLDLELQELAEKSLLNASKSWGNGLQALIVAADPRSCEIRTYVGGTNYSLSQLDRIRQSKRPIGSLMKPLELSPLLETDPKIHLAARFEDKPMTWRFDSGRSEWTPNNYDGKYRDELSLRQTLEESINLPIVNIFYQRVPSGLLEDILDPVRALGLDIPKERALPSALLGAIEQSPWTTLLAYLRLTRQALGLSEDAADLACQLKFEHKDENITLTKGSWGQAGSRLTIAALEGALRRGTSKALGEILPTTQEWAAKTGTSSDKRDAWHVTLSPDLVVLGWVGFDNNAQTDFTGASGPLPLVTKLLNEWSKRKGPWSWPKVEKLDWYPVTKDRSCRPAATLEALIKSRIPVPISSTPPTQAFEYEGKSYYYELFKNDATPEICSEENKFQKSTS